MTVSDAIALALFVLALAWLIAVGVFWGTYKLPTRSLLQQATRPSASDEDDDLAQIRDTSGRLLKKTLRLWPVAFLSFLASIIVMVVR